MSPTRINHMKYSSGMFIFEELYMKRWILVYSYFHGVYDLTVTYNLIWFDIVWRFFICDCVMQIENIKIKRISQLKYKIKTTSFALSV